jgi:hypothetical protein
MSGMRDYLMPDIMHTPPAYFACQPNNCFPKCGSIWAGNYWVASSRVKEGCIVHYSEQEIGWKPL